MGSSSASLSFLKCYSPWLPWFKASLPPNFFAASLDSFSGMSSIDCDCHSYWLKFYTLGWADFIHFYGLSVSRSVLLKPFSTGALHPNHRMQNSTQLPVCSVLLRRASVFLGQGRDVRSFQMVEALAITALVEAQLRKPPQPPGPPALLPKEMAPVSTVLPKTET